MMRLRTLSGPMQMVMISSRETFSRTTTLSHSQLHFTLSMHPSRCMISTVKDPSLFGTTGHRQVQSTMTSLSNCLYNGLY